MLLCALAAGCGPAAAAGCGFVELFAPGEAAGGKREMPLYLAFPDSLGALPVRAFLDAPPEKAQAMLKPSDWQAKALTAPERRMLQALRNLVQGRVREAGEEFAALSGQERLPRRLASGLRVDRALILMLAGFPADAEKEWRGVLRTASGCEEVAWRNLYSLYLGRRDFAAANALVDEALKGEPKNKWANAAKGYLLRMLMGSEDWERFLREKSSWRDSLFEIQIAYAKFLKDKGRFEEARKYYGRGLEGSPKNGQAWLELGDVQYRLGYYVFAETCLRNAFAAGVNDPYVFELYGLVLTGLSTYAADGRAMRELGYGWDAAWAMRCWQMAERILEDGFPHDLHSRSMAQLLYHIYCHNGRVEAAGNLRAGFWFHFTGPAIPKQPRLGTPPLPPFRGLPMRLGFVGFPLLAAASATDFYEPF